MGVGRTPCHPNLAMMGDPEPLRSAVGLLLAAAKCLVVLPDEVGVWMGNVGCRMKDAGDAAALCIPPAIPLPAPPTGAQPVSHCRKQRRPGKAFVLGQHANEGKSHCFLPPSSIFCLISLTYYLSFIVFGLQEDDYFIHQIRIF